MNYEIEFNNLRNKLDVLGYRQSLPIGAIPLVNALFQDLIKTTESLRDSKLQIDKLLEEKSCWELGVEPYKCDNSRLLAECNKLNLELIKQRENYEQKCLDLMHKIRKIELDKRHLEEHCMELENQIRNLTSTKGSDSKNLKNKKDGINMNKRPFISTVRSGVIIPPDPQNQNLPTKCGKCHAAINWSKVSVMNAHDIEKLHNDIKEQSDLVLMYKKKIESRDREIHRLNELLSGGRPAIALAKDCCYKDVGTLSEDIELLQKEKIENLRKINEYQGSMHEAMQKAVDLIERNKKLQNDLDEFKRTALDVEEQANREILEKSQEIEQLKCVIQKLENKIQCLEGSSTSESDYRRSYKPSEDKRKLHERLNELTVREQELRAENEKLNQKYQKIKTKFCSIQKENDEKPSTTVDEEKIRLKSERDFFQKEYLRVIEKSSSEKEISFLQSQINAKDDELRELRSELSQLKAQSTRSTNISQKQDACVQASILRIERERDVIKTELERIKYERDTLREKLLKDTQMKYDEIQKYENEIQQLKSNIIKLEQINNDLTKSQIPKQTHIVMLKEEIDELKKRIFELQADNNRISTQYNQLKILHEQTEKNFIEYQNKLASTETKLENSESLLIELNTNRDVIRNEISALKNEISILKSTNTTLENEKDKIVSELDLKTEKIYRLEHDLKELNKRKMERERIIQELQTHLDKAASERRERECELHECQVLREQLEALKASREEAIRENGELSTKVIDLESGLCLLRRHLKDSEKEVERLKQMAQQYVSKVKKTEELLIEKEREREEMLEHYRSLSHDAVISEGNIHSLELEALEQKRLLSEAEVEIKNLRDEIKMKDEIIEKLELQILTLSGQIENLEKELEQSYDDQRLLKVDLDAMKELCDKLDLQRDKLNAELEELQNIRTKLEQENEKLRIESSGLGATSPGTTTTTTTINRTNVNDRLTANSLQELLSASRRELEIHRSTTAQMAKEMKQLKQKVDDLQIKLNEQCDKAAKNEALAKEYSVQVKELQNTLTDDRFKRFKNNEKDTSPSYKERLRGGMERKFKLRPSVLNSSSRPSQIPKSIHGSGKSEILNQKYKIDSKMTKVIKDLSGKVDDGQKLEKHILEYLARGHVTKKDSSSSYGHVSFSEHSEDIVARKTRVIKHTKVLKNEANLINNANRKTPLRPSTCHSDETPLINLNASAYTPTSYSLDSSPRNKKTKEINHKNDHLIKKRFLLPSKIRYDDKKSFSIRKSMTPTNKITEDLYYNKKTPLSRHSYHMKSHLQESKNKSTESVPISSFTQTSASPKKLQQDVRSRMITKKVPMKSQEIKKVLFREESKDGEEILVRELHSVSNVFKEGTESSDIDDKQPFRISREVQASTPRCEKYTQSTDDFENNEIDEQISPTCTFKQGTQMATSTPNRSKKEFPYIDSANAAFEDQCRESVCDLMVGEKSMSDPTEKEQTLFRTFGKQDITEPITDFNISNIQSISRRSSPCSTRTCIQKFDDDQALSLCQKKRNNLCDLKKPFNVEKKLLKRSPQSCIATFNLPIVPTPPPPPPTFRGCKCMKARRDALRKKIGLPISGDEESENSEDYDYIFFRRSVICKSSSDNRLEQKELHEINGLHCMERNGCKLHINTCN